RKPQSPSSSGKQELVAKKGWITIGMDLGDKTSRYCVLAEGEAVKEGSVATTKKGLRQVFGSRRRCRIALEVGTHSPWGSRDHRERFNSRTSVNISPVLKSPGHLTRPRWRTEAATAH
ncbi:MAG TPA: hypothetical protein VGR73_05850, partial [Bryobacteraceae bacterium]|nr:hypothetical protein [Bryobacteraceae bacterium]